MQKKFKQYLLIVIAIAVPIVLIWLYFCYTDLHPSTDDASLQVDVVTVASLVQGRVTQLDVKNQQQVKKGQTLFVIDSEPYLFAVQAAQAKLAQAQQEMMSGRAEMHAANALVAQAQSQYELAQMAASRILPLVKLKDLPATQGDKVRADLTAAAAMLQSAKSKSIALQAKLGPDSNANPVIQAAQAELKKAQYQLTNTQYKAPIDGEIANLNFSVGDLVPPGKILFMIVPNDHFQVVANFKETQLTHIKLGSPVKININMYPDVKFAGVVKAIAKGSTEAFSLLPAQNSTGNWVNIAKRYAVIIDFVNLDPHYPLRLGASCTAKIN